MIKINDQGIPYALLYIRQKFPLLQKYSHQKCYHCLLVHAILFSRLSFCFVGNIHSTPSSTREIKCNEHGDDDSDDNDTKTAKSSRRWPIVRSNGQTPLVFVSLLSGYGQFRLHLFYLLLQFQGCVWKIRDPAARAETRWSWWQN